MIELTDTNFEEVYKTKGIFIVELCASWCGPCKIMAGRLEKHEEALGYTAGKIDLQQNHVTLNKYYPNGLPVCLVFLDGEPQKMVKGVVEPYEIIKSLK